VGRADTIVDIPFFGFCVRMACLRLMNRLRNVAITVIFVFGCFVLVAEFCWIFGQLNGCFVGGVLASRIDE
jgi:hypothetical protein